jgi:hypothetical protein
MSHVLPYAAVQVLEGSPAFSCGTKWFFFTVGVADLLANSSIAERAECSGIAKFAECIGFAERAECIVS